MAIDLHKVRLVPTNEQTIERMRRWKHSRDWPESKRNVIDLIYALCMAQVPEVFWNMKLDGLVEEEPKEIGHKFKKNIKTLVGTEGLGLFIHGESGTGKSFLAADVTKTALNNGFSAWFYDNHQFTKDVTDSLRQEPLRRKVDAIVDQADVLVLDNIGTGWEKGLRSLLMGRVEAILRARAGKTTIITVLNRHRKDMLNGSIEEVAKEYLIRVDMGEISLRAETAKIRFEELTS